MVSLFLSCRALSSPTLYRRTAGHFLSLFFMYSTLGINWPSIRYDDPFGRGFEYVPFSEDDLYGPIN